MRDPMARLLLGRLHHLGPTRLRPPDDKDPLVPEHVGRCLPPPERPKARVPQSGGRRGARAGSENSRWAALRRAAGALTSPAAARPLVDRDPEAAAVVGGERGARVDARSFDDGGRPSPSSAARTSVPAAVERWAQGDHGDAGATGVGQVGVMQGLARSWGPPRKAIPGRVSRVHSFFRP
jgi:hypothetical protein